MDTPSLKRKKHTVLVVEANDESAYVAREFLSRHRLKVVTERQVKPALLRATGAVRPDIMLLNYRLDRFVTLDMIRDIRRFEAETGRDRLPVVVTSAVIGIDWEQESTAAGADRVLAMPFTERQAAVAVWGAFWDVRHAGLKLDPLYELLAMADDDDEDDHPPWERMH